MEVGRLEVMADDKEWMSIQVQLCDFAGQDIYYSTALVLHVDDWHSTW